MKQFQGSGAQVVQTVGKGIPQKCQTQQKNYKRPGPVKIWTSAEKRSLEKRREREKENRENVKPNSIVKMPLEMKRHCGPNARRFSVAQLSQINGIVGNKKIPNIGEEFLRF
jgi:hypothetical protein